MGGAPSDEEEKVIETYWLQGWGGKKDISFGRKEKRDQIWEAEQKTHTKYIASR